MHAKQYPSIEKIVEIDTVAAGSHMETKRGIDYTQKVALWMILCSHHLLILDLNLKLSHIRQGTGSTAQPTTEKVCSAEREKGKRLPDDQSKRRNYIISIKSKAERSAQFFGCFLAPPCYFFLPAHSGIYPVLQKIFNMIINKSI